MNFLPIFINLYPQRLVKILTEQAEDLVDPPMSVQEVLEDLTLNALRFVSIISPYF